MYLSRLFIKNFRSVKELDLPFSKGKNVLVGRNNAGKSNVIKALDLVLGESSPTWAKSENITDNDFYTWKEITEDKEVIKAANEIYIWCELCRDDDEELDYDEIYKCAGYYVYSRKISPYSSSREPIRLDASCLPQNYEEIFNKSEDDNTEKEYINPKLRSQGTFERQLADKYHFAFAFRAGKDGEGRIQKDLRFLYRESEERDWILSFRTPIRCELLQSAIIPSFRDPQNQLRLNNWTWYGKLMKYLTADHVTSDDLRNALDNVKAVADNIFSSVKTEIAESSLNIAFPGTEIHFQFNADTRTDLYKNCVIYVDDGFKSQLTEKGSGIQSATIIGLFNYYTQFVNTKTSALLCIEEPEIYLHPHARRVISDRLDDFLAGGKNQVILTTHSAEFIRTTSPDLNVLVVVKDKEGSKARPIQIREYKHLLLDNNQNELFFADKVIICEGYDSYILRAVAKELFPGKLDEQNISIVQVGGKDNISRLIKLVMQLELRCFIFADFDYFLRDKSESAKKYGAKQHESLINCGLPFFNQTCTFDTRGKKVYDAVQKFRDELKKENEEKFYCAKQSTEFSHQKLSELLSLLRKHGIGILSNELEGLSKDGQIMASTKKLDLEGVFSLNARLNSGVDINEILDAVEIAEFLEAVFSS